ncbi:DUF397 domain-containing protein [Amycolatopsis sp. SB7-3]|uniref:DUF397 domain-containing protein n=1 Tax=Amycolatopsis sp. SB7-3 TaxID=3373438 RepID=UPI0037429EC0
MSNLFESDLTDAQWTTFCGGGAGGDDDGDQETCLELASVEGGYALRNNQDPNGTVIRATGAELTNFVNGLRDQGIV